MSPSDADGSGGPLHGVLPGGPGTAFAAQDHGIYDEDWATAKPTPTDFRAWCRDVRKPAVDARTS